MAKGLFNTPEYQHKHEAYCQGINAEISKVTQEFNALPASEQQSQRAQFAERIWHLQRKLGITGSEVASFMGLNKWRTKYQAWADKTGRNPVPFNGNSATRWGHLLEPVVAQAYAESTLSTIYQPGTLVNKDYPFLLGNLDRVVLDSNGKPCKILEIKTAAQNYKTDSLIDSGEQIKAWGVGNTYDEYGHCILEDDTIPLAYKLQVMHYMTVSGLKVADVAALIATSDFRIYTIHYDESLAKDMIEACEQIWCENILDDMPPEKVEADVKHERPLLASSQDADEYVAAKCAELKELKLEKKKLEERESELRDSILGVMDDKEELRYEGKVLATYKYRNGRQAFNTKLFQSEHPDLYKQYLTQGEGYRTFLLK